MYEINVYDKDGNVINELVQWDLDVELYINEPEIDFNYPVHFFNRKSSEAMVMDSTYDGEYLITKVPNGLLQQPYSLTGYIFVQDGAAGKSVYVFHINVKAKPIPCDYVCGDTEDYLSLAGILTECRILADLADQYADESGVFAQNSYDSSVTSESWAVGGTGTRDGEDENNSKYYSEQSSDYANKSSDYADESKSHADDSADSATLSESWAIGGTGTRDGEDEDNSKYYSEQSEDYALGDEDSAKHYYELTRETFDAIAVTASSYGVCEAEADEANKEITTAYPVEALEAGISVNIKFINGNTAESPTLNVDGFGAYPMKAFDGTDIQPNMWYEEGVVEFLFDGENWVMVDGQPAYRLKDDMEETDIDQIFDTYLIVPTQSRTLVYTGYEQTAKFSDYDPECLAISGDTTGIDAQTYTAVFTPIGYRMWMDGSNEPREVKWAIEQRDFAVPTQKGTLTYNASEQVPIFNDYDPEHLDISGDLSGTDAGGYTVVFTLKDENTRWEDGTTEPKEVVWEIQRCALDISFSNNSFVYNGTEQTPIVGNYNANGIIIDGTPSATEAGDYHVILSLENANYCWLDGTNEEKEMSWSIAKASCNFTLSSNSVSINSSNSSATVTYSRDGDGKVTCSNSDQLDDDPDVNVKVEITDTSIIFTGSVKSGGSITIGYMFEVEETDNYLGDSAYIMVSLG